MTTTYSEEFVEERALEYDGGVYYEFIGLTKEEMTKHREKIKAVISKSISEGVQELTLIAGEYPVFKTQGRVEVNRTLGEPWSADDINFFLTKTVKTKIPGRLDTTASKPRTSGNGDDFSSYLDTQFFEALMDFHGNKHDLSVAHSSKTLRIHCVNLFDPTNLDRHMKYGISIRIVPKLIPEWDTLNLPKLFKKVVKADSGLFLVSGHASDGKTTTVASLINMLNVEAGKINTILTIEEPVEFVYSTHEGTGSVIQRSVGVNVDSYSQATLDALRENVSYVMIGELRDKDEMLNALKLVEMGKVVIATIHSNGSAETIDRFVNAFPSEMQTNVRQTLIENIGGILHQRLEVVADKDSLSGVKQVPSCSGFLINTSSERSVLRSAEESEGRAGIVKVIENEGAWTISNEDHYKNLVAQGVVIDTVDNHRKFVPQS